MDGAEVSGIDFNRRAGRKTPFYLDALICEPDFAAKLKSGAQDGSKCLACNGCYTIYRKRFVRRFCFRYSMTICHVNEMK